MKIISSARCGFAAAVIMAAGYFGGASAHEPNPAEVTSDLGGRPINFSEEINKRLHDATCIQGKTPKGKPKSDHKCRGGEHLGHERGMIIITVQMDKVDEIRTLHNVRCISTEINVLTSNGLQKIWPLAGSDEDKDRDLEALHCIP